MLLQLQRENFEKKNVGHAARNQPHNQRAAFLVPLLLPKHLNVSIENVLYSKHMSTISAAPFKAFLMRETRTSRFYALLCLWSCWVAIPI